MLYWTCSNLQKPCFGLAPATWGLASTNCLAAKLHKSPCYWVSCDQTSSSWRQRLLFALKAAVVEGSDGAARGHSKDNWNAFYPWNMKQWCSALSMLKLVQACVAWEILLQEEDKCMLTLKLSETVNKACFPFQLDLNEHILAWFEAQQENKYISQNVKLFR